MYLFVQSWDIVRGKEAEYTDFVLRRHLPAMQRIGLNMIGGFHVIVGGGPRISTVASADDFGNIQQALQTDEFLRITQEIQKYIANYNNRLFKHTERVKKEAYSIEIGTWRLNQHYTLVPGVDKEYAGFLATDFVPTLAGLGIRTKAEWQGILGSGPYRILMEGVAQSIHDIASALISDEFRRLKRTLLSRYARNYSSRILAPTGRVEIAFILGEMTKSL